MSTRGRVGLSTWVGALVVVFLFAPSASASHPQCFGLDPTPVSVAPSGTVMGTPGDDVIVGTSGADRIDGAGGDDTICGGDGGDRIDGGSGADEIDGGSGDDRLKGHGGDDLLSGASGDDKLIGAEGDDLLRGQSGADDADGGDGADTCDAEVEAACESDPQTRLVTGMTFAIPTTNPAVSTAGGVHAYWETMYNGLIALDANGMPVPELATRVPTVHNGDITDGGATYTFRLRDDVSWHDGVPFTAADVKFTFEKALLLHHGRTRNMAGALASWDPVAELASIDVVDDHTVRFRFAQPYAPLLQQLNVTEAPMLPAHRYIGNPTLAQLNANKIGTGPMKFDVVTPTEARVVRNPSYFRAPLPYLDEIVMRPLIDDNARLQALLTGGVDFAWDVPDQSVASLQGNPAFRTESTQSLGGGANSIDQLVFNLTASGDRRGQMGGPEPAGTPDPHPILGGTDPQSSGAKVRRAIAHAVNRDDYLNVGRSGIGTVAQAPISSELAFHATDVGLPGFDAARANALLEEAGWVAPAGVMSGSNPRVARDHPNENNLNPALRIPDGTPLRLRLVPPSAIFANRVALVDAQLGAVGIDLQVTGGSIATSVFIERNFDTTVLNYAQGYDPHIGVRRQYHSDQVSTTNVTNAAGYKNALVDEAFDEAARTIDFDARFARYHAFQEQVAQDLPYVWLIETPNVRGFTERCQRFKVYTGLFAEGAVCRTAP